MSPTSRSHGHAAAGSTKAAHSSSALLQEPQDSQEVATAPDEAETEDELDTAGAADVAAAGADALAADSLSQQLQGLAADGETQRQQRKVSSRSSSTNSISSLWETAQPLALKYFVPAVLLLVSVRLLLLKLRGGKQRQQQDQKQQPEQQPEPLEPEPTLAVYASDYVYDPPSPRAGFLEGLRCVAAENVAVPVSKQRCCGSAKAPDLPDLRSKVVDHSAPSLVPCCFTACYGVYVLSCKHTQQVGSRPTTCFLQAASCVLSAPHFLQSATFAQALVTLSHSSAVFLLNGCTLSLFP
jgi:hypothetical protein